MPARRRFREHERLRGEECDDREGALAHEETDRKCGHEGAEDVHDGLLPGFDDVTRVRAAAARAIGVDAVPAC
jgi:hypothetical protein